MKIIVFGGDGFIGSYIVEQLLLQNHKVTIFGRFPYGRLKNLEKHRNKISIINGDFLNTKDISNALSGQEVLYHMITVSSPISSWSNPLIEVEVNLKGSLNLFEIACNTPSILKIVYSSSGGTVYGPSKDKINENTLPQPFSPHGICKLAIEHFLNYFKEKSLINVDIYRIGNAIGPRQSFNGSQGVLSIWFKRILMNEQIFIYGDDTVKRDYIDVKDVALLMTHSVQKIDLSDTYNISSGTGVGIIELFELVKSIVNCNVNYKLSPKRQSDNSSIVLDNTKILSFFPDYKLQKIETSIQKEWEYIQINKKLLIS
jgi:UDP-glucose 4-epimerase